MKGTPDQRSLSMCNTATAYVGHLLPYRKKKIKKILNKKRKTPFFFLPLYLGNGFIIQICRLASIFGAGVLSENNIVHLDCLDLTQDLNIKHRVNKQKIIFPLPSVSFAFCSIFRLKQETTPPQNKIKLTSFASRMSFASKELGGSMAIRDRICSK